MTDFGSPALLAPYGMLLLPLPGWMCTTLFSAASVLHFAEDVGLALSGAMHLLLAVGAAVNMDASFFAMSLYFCFVHTPLHYARLLCEGKVVAVVLALLITAAMAAISAVPAWSARAARLLPESARMLAPLGDDRSARPSEDGIHVTHMMQRLVCAHVAVEVLRRATSGLVWLPPIGPPRYPLLVTT